MKKMLSVFMIGTALLSPILIQNSLAEASSSIEKKESKVVVALKDGSVITEDEVKKELDDVPQQLSSQMSLAELKKSMTWYLAYQKIMNEVVKKSDVYNKKDVKAGIEKRKITAAGFMLLDKKANESMTHDALKEHYDKTWKENFKDTKEFSLVAITTNNKNLANKIKESVKDDESLKQTLDSNTSLKHMEMENKPQGMFPPEISSAVLKQGKHTVIGPFEIKTAYMLFYIKDIRDAKKQEFTEDFEENYKKIASRDFIQQYTKELYKKYNVKIMDTNGKEVDPFKIADKNADKTESKKTKPVDLTKVKDDLVMATIDGEKITVADIKKFFKVGSLVDEAFISMAQQFNIKPEEVITYAVKLIADDKVLTKEVKETKYDDTPEVKEKLRKIEEMEYQHAFYKENIKVTV
ncbi:MAG: peptidyl-prolyl cis-trans isomerase [Holosporales bacterium]|nr:peptidyl-prolyl cis-trans isomerase [Holosporales bacterium]